MTAALPAPPRVPSARWGLLVLAAWLVGVAGCASARANARDALGLPEELPEDAMVTLPAQGTVTVSWRGRPTELAWKRLAAAPVPVLGFSDGRVLVDASSFAGPHVDVVHALGLPQSVSIQSLKPVVTRELRLALPGGAKVLVHPGATVSSNKDGWVLDHWGLAVPDEAISLVHGPVAALPSATGIVRATVTPRVARAMGTTGGRWCNARPDTDDAGHLWVRVGRVELRVRASPELLVTPPNADGARPPPNVESAEGTVATYGDGTAAGTLVHPLRRMTRACTGPPTDPWTICVPPESMVRRTGDDAQASPFPLHRTRPVFPSTMRGNVAKGGCIVSVTVDLDGSVESAALKTCSDGFAEASLASAREWTFTPARTAEGWVRSWFDLNFLYSARE